MAAAPAAQTSLAGYTIRCPGVAHQVGGNLVGCGKMLAVTGRPARAVLADSSPPGPNAIVVQCQRCSTRVTIQLGSSINERR